MNYKGIPFGPPRASQFAPEVDALFLFELAISAFAVLGIFMTIVYFAIRYRRRSEDEVPPKTGQHYAIEAIWSIVPFSLMLVMFFWGAGLYSKMKRPAPYAVEIHVIGKQWMWKFEHTDGIREINQLHIPINQPVKLIMASQDVIHDFFVPAFRVKQDIVPGSYVTEWFIPTRTGEFRFFCSQYCGTDHSRMAGSVIVMEPSDYQAWHAGVLPSEPPAAAGQKLFTTYGCIACHGQRAPTLAGLYNSRVQLQDGSVVVADENYLRRSILDPTNQIVAGFPPIMPSYRGQLSEEQLFQLISYIKSLQPVANVSGKELTEPSTRPAPADQPSIIPNFPPAESPYPIVPPQRHQGEPPNPFGGK